MTKRTVEQDMARYNRDWLTPAQAAARLPIGLTRVYEEIAAGRLRAVNASEPDAAKKHWRIDPAWVEAWIVERTNTDAA